jgi:hypothetical protein
MFSDEYNGTDLPLWILGVFSKNLVKGSDFSRNKLLRLRRNGGRNFKSG